MSWSIDCISDFIFAQSSLIDRADVILVPGGSQPQATKKASELYLSGLAPLVLPSGGPNHRLPKGYYTEWQFLKDVAVESGVPEKYILKEDQATNTFANARFSLKVLSEKGIAINRAILVCKAFHARRALLTYQYCFPPEVTFFVVGVPEKNGICKENWHKSPQGIDLVFGELNKISRYFADKVHVLTERPGLSTRTR